jgi:predicted PurR-regulated permease PerM
MVSECKIDQKYIQQMFPDLDRLIELHKNLLDQLMERYKSSENKYIESIGDILLDIVSFLLRLLIFFVLIFYPN